jgi:hypothetical protein
VNVALLAFAATVTDPGTVRETLVSVSVTTAALGVAFVSVTVHVLEFPDPRLVGLQLNDDTSTAAVRPTVVPLELPAYVAVTVAL